MPLDETALDEPFARAGELKLAMVASRPTAWGAPAFFAAGFVDGTRQPAGPVELTCEQGTASTAAPLYLGEVTPPKGWALAGFDLMPTSGVARLTAGVSPCTVTVPFRRKDGAVEKAKGAFGVRIEPGGDFSLVAAPK